MARQLIVLGLLIAAIGAVMALGVPLGRLPGDFTFRRDSFSFYFKLLYLLFNNIQLFRH